MRSLIATAIIIALGACSPPVQFRVDVDEPVRSGALYLREQATDLQRNFDGAYWAQWHGSDASGRIDIVFEDGQSASCKVGYVTHGMIDVQRYTVRDRKCEAVLAKSSPHKAAL